MVEYQSKVPLIRGDLVPVARLGATLIKRSDKIVIQKPTQKAASSLPTLCLTGVAPTQHGRLDITALHGQALRCPQGAPKGTRRALLPLCALRHPPCPSLPDRFCVRQVHPGGHGFASRPLLLQVHTLLPANLLCVSVSQVSTKWCADSNVHRATRACCEPGPQC